jgi:2-polyprenyl-3-methyl-5-hydroxy-6-metoxy-1,4-benzoquinol methylase
MDSPSTHSDQPKQQSASVPPNSAAAGASHLDDIRKDSEYVDILANWDPGFYGKYTHTLGSPTALTAVDGPVLDVGCGVGQVVLRLLQNGVDVQGVDVARANIDHANKFTDRCRWYDGQTLPFPDNKFARVGALNVLEHVESPESFLQDMIRVTQPGGLIIVSSPNFLRFFGWRDYHPRMRGLKNKWRNLQALCARRKQMRTSPESVRFERMTPIVKQPFTPDDDAIVCTNALDIQFFLARYGCQIVTVSCADRYIPGPLDFLLNVTPIKYGLFNAFVIARKAVEDK